MNQKCKLITFIILANCICLFLYFIPSKYKKEIFKYNYAIQAPITHQFEKKQIQIPHVRSENLFEMRLKINTKWKDSTRKFGIQHFIWPSSNQTNKDAVAQVCLATHTTVDGLHWIAYQAEFFQGPISVSVFTPGKDIDIAARMITYLQQCHPPVKKLVNFHILYPISNQADYTNNTLKALSSDISCSIDAEDFNKQLLVSRRSADIRSCQVYPQNIARNLGWTGCKSSHVLNVDVDMIPNYGLAQMLDPFLAKNVCQKCAYIAPVYEIKNKEDFPAVDKKTLLSLINKRLAQIFHIKVFKYNQHNSNLSQWEKTPNESFALDVMYSVKKYALRWEPIMVLSYNSPLFIEQFVGYGFTRNSHVFLLNSKRYQFKVLNLAFVNHRGFQIRKYPKYRNDQVEKNFRIYLKMKADILAGWPSNWTASPFLQWT